MKRESLQRNKKYFYRFFPFLLIFFAWFIFSSQYFLRHRIPYPAEYQVSFFSPWNAYPQYQIPSKNNSLSDVVNEMFPWKHFTIESLKKGQVPLWNPYSFSGTPHLANYQSAVFSPFNLLFFVLPFIDGWSLLILLQPFLAGLFMYLFLRELRITPIGSVLGSIAFMFCGFMVSWMAWGTLAMAISFLPLCLFAIEKIFQQRRIFCFLLAGGLAISFFSGHFQTSLYLSLYTFAYALFKFITTKDRQAFLWTIGSYFIGLGISLLQIAPTLEVYRQTVRSELFVNKFGIPFYYLVTLFAPDFFGNPVTRNDWMSFYPEWASFIGIIPFTLALVSLFLAKNKKLVFFFFFAGIAALLFSLDTPLQSVLSLLKVPVFSSSIPSRIIVLFSFSFAVLAGFGLDALSEAVEKKRFSKVIYPFFAIGIFLIFLWVFLFFPHVLPKDKAMLAVRNMILPSFLFFVGSMAVLIAFRIKRKVFVLVLVWILIMTTMVDSLHFAMKWMPFDSKELVSPSLPVIEAMQKDVGNGRVYGDFGAYIDTYFHIPSVEGYDPLYLKRYGDFLASAKNGTLANNEKSIARLDRRGKYTDRALDLLGVNLIYNPISFVNQPWAYPVWGNPQKYTLIYQDNKFQLYRNNSALPRVKLFYNHEVIKGDKELMGRFYNDTFDFRNTILLEESPNFTKTRESIESEARFISYSPNKVIISTATRTPAILFFSDSYYPQWKVKVNGREEKLYRADYSFRAVVVPEGNSIVEFYYSGLL